MISKQCFRCEMYPASGLAPLSGRDVYRPNPGLKPWAMLLSHFMAFGRAASWQYPVDVLASL